MTIQPSKFARSRRHPPPVLFVNIGWAERYDGTEQIEGNHGWLEEHADDCSELAAFFREPGEPNFWCGIGSGSVGAEHLDVVFVARRPGEIGTHRLVGVYLDATCSPKSPKEPKGWMFASARTAVLFPINDRPKIRDWPGQMNMRRWAYSGAASATTHRTLQGDYWKALRLAVKYKDAGPPKVNGEDDEVLSGFEGEERVLFVKHRLRERTLRMEKIREAFRANGGKLRCEVTDCGFDFEKAYGPLGRGFAHVHHKKPLSAMKGRTRVSLDDLAVVCANCHAMIHLGGKCRPLGRLRRR